MIDTTEQCIALGTSAHPGAADHVTYDRFQVEEFKRRAALTHPQVRAGLLRIAASHEQLLRLAGDLLEDHEPQPDIARVSNAAEHREGLLKQEAAEDPIAQARRHVAEAHDHIARQEALVARLSSDDRHVALAAEAKEILDTLKHSLSLAQQHLDLELKK